MFKNKTGLHLCHEGRRREAFGDARVLARLRTARYVRASGRADGREDEWVLATRRGEAGRLRAETPLLARGGDSPEGSASAVDPRPDVRDLRCCFWTIRPGTRDECVEGVAGAPAAAGTWQHAQMRSSGSTAARDGAAPGVQRLRGHGARTRAAVAHVMSLPVSHSVLSRSNLDQAWCARRWCLRGVHASCARGRGSCWHRAGWGGAQHPSPAGQWAASSREREREESTCTPGV